VPVECQFIPDIKQYQNSTGNADRRADDIQNRIEFVFQNVTIGGKKVAFDHVSGILLKDGILQ
jgi:tetrahydromethanopterin S-methyltransferase subunit G